MRNDRCGVVRAACFTGLRVNRHNGDCKDGTTTCNMLDENTKLTRHVEVLSREIDSLTKVIHDRVAGVGGG